MSLNVLLTAHYNEEKFKRRLRRLTKEKIIEEYLLFAQNRFRAEFKDELSSKEKYR